MAHKKTNAKHSSLKRKSAKKVQKKKLKGASGGDMPVGNLWPVRYP